MSNPTFAEDKLMAEWQPIETAPEFGEFLVAGRFPTNWAWIVTRMQFLEAQANNYPPKYRERRLAGYSHWQEFHPPKDSP